MHGSSMMKKLGLPSRDGYELPTSTLRFADGTAWHVEIPSCEGPQALAAVIDEARLRSVPVHRVSQGSGIMLQTDAEIVEMVALGAEHAIEICLFVGPRAAWDSGVQASSPGGQVVAAALRGADQLAFGLSDIIRATELGIRSVLIADLGLLHVVGQLKASGDLPPDLIVKVSASLPAANPATARLLEDLGATTLNLPVDLALPMLAAIRSAVQVPLDMYIESSDDFGGVVRHYEIPAIVRVAAPVHLKFAVRNAPNIYPAGQHIAATVQAMARERVRRAQIGLALLARYRDDPDAAVTIDPAIPTEGR